MTKDDRKKYVCARNEAKARSEKTRIINQKY